MQLFIPRFLDAIKLSQDNILCFLCSYFPNSQQMNQSYSLRYVLQNYGSRVPNLQEDYFHRMLTKKPQNNQDHCNKLLNSQKKFENLLAMFDPDIYKTFACARIVFRHF